MKTLDKVLCGLFMLQVVALALLVQPPALLAYRRFDIIWWFWR